MESKKIFHHGMKYLVIKNKYSGNVENIRSKHNYYIEDKDTEIEKIRNKFSEGDFEVLSVSLS